MLDNGEVLRHWVSAIMPSKIIRFGLGFRKVLYGPDYVRTVRVRDSKLVGAPSFFADGGVFTNNFFFFYSVIFSRYIIL